MKYYKNGQTGRFLKVVTAVFQYENFRMARSWRLVVVRGGSCPTCILDGPAHRKRTVTSCAVVSQSITTETFIARAPVLLVVLVCCAVSVSVRERDSNKRNSFFSSSTLDLP